MRFSKREKISTERWSPGTRFLLDLRWSYKGYTKMSSKLSYSSDLIHDLVFEKVAVDNTVAQ